MWHDGLALDGEDERPPDSPASPELRQERRGARGRARAAEADDQRVAGKLAAAMREFHAFRASGVLFEDCVAGLEEVLRGLFRVTRFPPVCDLCDGSGRMTVVCDYRARCNRKSCGQADPGWSHRYVIACDCSLGEAFRYRRRAPAVELEQVGRTQPRRRGAGWKRPGL